MLLPTKRKIKKKQSIVFPRPPGYAIISLMGLIRWQLPSNNHIRMGDGVFITWIIYLSLCVFYCIQYSLIILSMQAGTQALISVIYGI